MKGGMLVGGKHEKREENRYRDRLEDLVVATGAGLLVKIIEWLFKMILNQ